MLVASASFHSRLLYTGVVFCVFGTLEAHVEIRTDQKFPFLLSRKVGHSGAVSRPDADCAAGRAGARRCS